MYDLFYVHCKAGNSHSASLSSAFIQLITKVLFTGSAAVAEIINMLSAPKDSFDA